MEKIVLDFLSAHGPLFQTLGYYIVFVSGFLESLPVAGFIIPGQTIVVIGGFFAKRKAVAFLLMLAFAAVGAILGDVVSYYLGKKYGESFLRKHGGKFFVKESLIESTKKLVREHTGKALFFGRLNGVTRSLAPFIAGTSGIETSTFLFYCTSGCFAWATIFVSVGYIFGRSFEVAAPVIGKFIILATLIVGALILLVQYMKKRGFTLSRYDIQLLVTNIVSIYVFTSIGQALAKGSQIIGSFDMRTERIIDRLHSPLFDKVMLIIGNIGEVQLIVLVGLLCLLLHFEKRTRESISLTLSLLTGYILVFFTKIIFLRPRPPAGMITLSDSSFPSGHATLSTLFFLIIIHTFTPKIPSGLRRFIFVTCNILLIITVCFSRVYLDVHYATDVIAGIALGAWVFSLTLLASKCAPWLHKKIKREQIIPNL